MGERQGLIPSSINQFSKKTGISANSDKGKKIRPGLKIRTKLLLLVFILLAIPWMGYESVREMEKFLLEGQEQALELTTQGISSLLGNRSDLFDPEIGVPELIGKNLINLSKKIGEPLSVDAPYSVWANAIGTLISFSDSGIFECGPEYLPHSFVVRHSMAIDSEQIYAFFEIDDDVVVFRDPELLALDTNDQLRMTVQQNSGALLRYLLTPQSTGRLSVYQMKQNWREVTSGEALRDIIGTFELTEKGYVLKIKIPRNIIGSGSRLKFDIVDVDDSGSRKPRQVISTQPDPTQHAVGNVRLVTPELAKLIEPLYLSEANITIWDSFFRVRASVGSIFPPGMEIFSVPTPINNSLLSGMESKMFRFYQWILRSPTRGFTDLPMDSSSEDERMLKRVVGNGMPQSERRRYGDAKLIVTSAPIWANGKIQGAVLIKQSGNKLLSLQYQTLQRFTLLFLGVFIFLAFAIFIFSIRLTYRVTRLQRETEQASTSEGRLLKDRIKAGIRAGDELGSLTRSISSMLHNLGQYTRYLEKLPDTLAHELHNPLNVVNSSLEILQYRHKDLTKDKHLLRARSGVIRLKSIITSLTEAASLKEALTREQNQSENFDLSVLVKNCVEAYQASNPDRSIIAECPIIPVLINGVPDRIFQMLDKLIDNAIQFGTDNGLIKVVVKAEPLKNEIIVLNDGPGLPNDIVERLFDPMVSSSKDARKSHLGLGLYIVRLVAEFHGGTAFASNRVDSSGVEVRVSLPVMQSI